MCRGFATGTRERGQMADRHAVASGEKGEKLGENMRRAIHIDKRGSETAHEEQPDEVRKTVRFEQEAPITSSSSTMHASFQHLTSGETQNRSEPALCAEFRTC